MTTRNDLVRAALEEIRGQRGGVPFLADLADLFGCEADELEATFTESLVDHGLTDDTSFGLVFAQRAFIFVEASSRRQGLGTALFASLRDSHPGCDMPVLPGNREWKSFAESAGYKARLIVMSEGRDADDEGR